MKKERSAFNYLILMPIPATQRWTSSAASAARWLTSPSTSRNLLPASLSGTTPSPTSSLTMKNGTLRSPARAQEPIELSSAGSSLRRNPQGEGVEQDRFPLLRRFEDFVRGPRSPASPPTRPALPVEPYAPLQVLVPSDGGSHIEDTLASQ